jgi:hypothetical protein
VTYYIVAFAVIFGISEEPSIPGPAKVVLAIGVLALAKFMNWATAKAYAAGAGAADEALGNKPDEGAEG